MPYGRTDREAETTKATKVNSKTATNQRTCSRQQNESDGLIPGSICARGMPLSKRAHAGRTRAPGVPVALGQAYWVGALRPRGGLVQSSKPIGRTAGAATESQRHLLPQVSMRTWTLQQGEEDCTHVLTCASVCECSERECLLGCF